VVLINKDSVMETIPLLILVQEIQLPADGAVGQHPIHTLRRDVEGNFYYTDEFAHRVVSVDANGEPRWSVGGMGNAKGQFHYPRGLSFGTIRAGTETIPCIAVCDSWNHRIQLISLSGMILATWNEAGGIAFNEVNDVRYFSEADAGSDGCWLVLDRCNHRICVLSGTGQQLSKIGSMLMPSLECKWRKAGLPIIQDCFPGGIQRTSRSFDPIYYPERIMGRASGPIFITEPLSGRMKQLVLGSLIPVWKSPNPQTTVIAADEFGLILCDPSSNRFSFMSPDGSMQLESEMLGHPIITDGSSRELWLQTKNSIQHWKYDGQTDLRLGCVSKFDLMLRSVESDVDALIPESVAGGIQTLIKIAGELFLVASRYIELSGDDAGTTITLRSMLNSAQSLSRSLEQAATAIYEQSYHAYIAAYKLALIQKIEPECLYRKSIRRAREELDKFYRPVSDMIIRGQELRDEIDVIGKTLDASAEEEYRLMVWQLDSTLEFAVIQLSRWNMQGQVLFELHGADALSTPDIAGSSMKGSDCRSSNRLHLPVSRCHDLLQETDRLSVEAPDNETPSRPWGIAQGPEGKIYVSLFQAKQIVELDSYGHTTAYTDPEKLALRGPLGICFDFSGRLWIADHLSKSILVFNPGEGDAMMSIPCNPGLTQAGSPVGICLLGDAVLVSEILKQRIFSVSLSGQTEIISQRFGRKPGEFRDPCFISPSLKSNGKAVWIVDHHNHRVQEINAEGQFLRQIGQCGLGKGKLTLPVSAVQVDEDTMIVAQRRPFPALKLLSTHGEESDMLELDYDPGGVLLQPGYLWVAEHSGSRIRIYAIS
jgi:hypothetical protein